LRSILRRRRRLRLPALAAAAFWLLVGVADAAAVGACAYHKGPEAQHTVSSTDTQESSPNHHQHEAATHAHGEHGAGVEGEPQSHDGSHDCECMTLHCTVACGVVVPEVSTSAERTEPVTSHFIESRPVSEARAPSAVLPFFLPLANAPPLS
jgi:hypothetical protein